MVRLKKGYYTFLILLLCLCFALFPLSRTDAQTTSDNSTTRTEQITYDFLDKNEMPILGYVGIPNANAGDAANPAENPSFINRTNFERYKEAGFNILSGLYERANFTDPDVHKALKLASEVGLAYFVNDTTFRCDSFGGTVESASEDAFREAMQNAWYLDASAFAGLAVKDEPSAQDYDGMAKVNKVLQELTDGKIIYTNLFPSYVETARLYLDNVPEGVWNAYEQYVYEYVDKVMPDIIAYDYYVFMNIDSSLENPLGTSNPIDIVSGEMNMQDYIKSLSLYRKISLDYNIPYWVSVASYNHRYHQLYTSKETAWQVNTSLAYGAKGIQYYTYWAGIDGSTMESWANPNKSGLVTANGTPHDTYYQVKEINENIKVVDEILMNSTSKGIIQFGKQTLPLVADDVLYGYGLLSDITGGDTFVGCFDYNGKSVYYIVNNSVNAGRTTFKADFLTNVDVRLYNLDIQQSNLEKGLTQDYVEYNSTQSVGFNLSGGDAILLEVL